MVGVVGLVLVAGVLLLGVLSPEADYSAWAYPALGFAAVLIWAALLRPAVSIEDDDLVLRNMLDQVSVPLAGVEQVAVRQFVTVRVGDRRYVGSGVSRSAFQVARDGRKPEAHPDRSYGAWVEQRIAAQAEQARAVRGIRQGSAEQVALQAEVRRAWAWPEAALLAVLGLSALVLALL